MVPPLELKLSITEQAAFDEAKRRVSEVLKAKTIDDDFVFRFLKAKAFDVDQTVHMIDKTLTWRKEKGVDTILSDFKPSEVIQKYLVMPHIGFDKEGRPVFYFSSGKLDIKGLLLSTKPSELEKAVITLFEKAEKTLEEQSEKLNKRITEYILISNVDGLSFANAADKKGIEFLLRSNQLNQENYPERLFAVYVINASAFYALHFSIVKNLVSSDFIKKIKVFGTEGWSEEFHEKFHMEEFPAFLGGEKTDPDGDPLCKTFINHGGKIEEKYYIHKSKKSIANHPDAKKLVLSRAAYSEIVIEVEEKDFLIEWEFEIKNRDIGFGLFYKEMVDGEEVITAIVSLQRQDTQDFAEVGLYNCDRPGTYVMLFDNSYSWIRSKEIYYKVKVVPSNERKLEMETKKEDAVESL